MIDDTEKKAPLKKMPRRIIKPLNKTPQSEVKEVETTVETKVETTTSTNTEAPKVETTTPAPTKPEAPKEEPKIHTFTKPEAPKEEPKIHTFTKPETPKVETKVETSTSTNTEAPKVEPITPAPTKPEAPKEEPKIRTFTKPETPKVETKVETSTSTNTEAPKVETTTPAPTKPEAPKEEPKIRTFTKPEAPKVETKVETSTSTNTEAPKVEPKVEPKIEPKVEPKIEPKTEQKAEKGIPVNTIPPISQPAAPVVNAAPKSEIPAKPTTPKAPVSTIPQRPVTTAPKTPTKTEVKAKEQKTAAKNGDNNAPKRSKKGLFIIIAIIVILLGVGATLFFLNSDKTAEPSQPKNDKKEIKKEDSEAPKETPENANEIEGFVYVKGGSFDMGSDSGQDDEKPVHSVTLNSFYIGECEVTQELWESVMESNPSQSIGNKKPVECVSWYEAIQFCNKLSKKEGLDSCYKLDENKNVIFMQENNGYRLPTEAEWEYAARGGEASKNYTYSGSNDADAVAWDSSNSSFKTQEVGKKKANELGIYDMSGNVYEWCWDWYGVYSGNNNPTGPLAGTQKVNRGGSFRYGAEYCSVSFRSNRNPVDKLNRMGLRLVRNSK